MTQSGTGGSSASIDGETDGAAEPRRSVARVVVSRTLLVAGVIFVLMQLVPYGWWHDNPPVVSSAPWPDAASEQIARTSCYSCHSNQTEWPVYSYVAPMSWLVRYDVEGGRDKFNFSDWDPGDADIRDAGVGRQHFLNFTRPHLITAGLNQILLPIDDEKKRIIVDVPEISRVQPRP